MAPNHANQNEPVPDSQRIDELTRTVNTLVQHIEVLHYNWTGPPTQGAPCAIPPVPERDRRYIRNETTAKFARMTTELFAVMHDQRQQAVLAVQQELAQVKEKLAATQTAAQDQHFREQVEDIVQEGELDKLRKFKELTHQLLSEAGIPVMPEAACRVRARMEQLIAERNSFRNHLRTLLDTRNWGLPAVPPLTEASDKELLDRLYWFVDRAKQATERAESMERKVRKALEALH